MYRSLVDTGCDFRMYILAMDYKCKEILNAYQYHNMVIIDIDDFVRIEGLSEIEKTRSRGEFCFTCTAFLIHYVLVYCGEKICTYVDADLFFYSNPQCLIDSMEEKTVQIVEHRYNPTVYGKLCHAAAGTYCVEFNTFKNTPDSIKLLNWWKDECFESCSVTSRRKGAWGDQGYLENWGKKNNVDVLKHLGGGMAPWNIIQYHLVSSKNGIKVREKKTGKIFELVFYHYHNIAYHSSYEVNISIHEPWHEDRKLVNLLYLEYLKLLDSAKNELKDKFDFYPLLTSHPAMNNKNRKTVKDYISAIDSLVLYKIYDKLIGSKKRAKYKYLNEISFDGGMNE